VVVYDTFSVNSESNNYRLTVGSFSSSSSNTSVDGLAAHNGQEFTTKGSGNDNDNDDDTNCAVQCGGGFWYDQCDCSLTGAWPNFNWHTYSPSSAMMYVMCP